MAASPLFVVGTHPGFSSSSAVLVSVQRMDGNSVINALGERYRQDRENWLTPGQVLAEVARLMSALPPR